MAEYPAWGIHITNVAVRGVMIAEEGSALRVVAHDQIDFAEDIDDLTSLQRFAAQLHALAVFVQRHDLQRSRIWISVDGATAFNRFVEAPTVSGESRTKILEYEAQQQIPFKLEEVYWDHKVLADVEAKSSIEVMLFAIKKEVVDDRVRRFQKMRFAVDGTQLAPIALYNFAAFEGYAKDGYVLVGLEYDRVDVVFCENGRMWFRTIPDGSHSWVEAIRDRSEVKHRVAVRIAKGEEEAPDEAIVKAAAKETTNYLVGEIARLIHYYRGARQDTKLRGIVLVNGTPLAPAIGAELKAKSGLDVFTVKGFRNIQIDDAIITPDIQDSVSSLAHAAGLALQGLERADIGVRLFDPTLERVIAGRRMYYILAMMVVFALIATMWIITYKEGRRLRDAELRLSGEMTRAEKLRDDIRKSQNEAKLVADIRAFDEISEFRDVPVKAVDFVVATVNAANAGKPAEERVYVVNIETASSTTTTRGQRTVTVLLGSQQRSTTEAAVAQVEGDVLTRLRTDARVSRLESATPFAAPTLSLTPVGDIEGRMLRRKFVMLPVTFMFEGRDS